MARNPFTDPRNLNEQSFPHALSPFSASESVATTTDEFVESKRVGVFIGEDGVVNIADQVMLWGEGEDVVDSKVEPRFSRENKFVKGLEKVLPGVPVGGVVAWNRLAAPPIGWGEADGSVYAIEGGGRVFEVPTIPDGFGGGGIGWIVKLPAGAVKVGGGTGGDIGN